MDNTLEVTKDIIRRVLKMPDLEITDNSSSDTIPEWDSLSHVMIIHEIEKKFDIKFSLDDMISIDSFGKLMNIIEAKN